MTTKTAINLLRINQQNLRMEGGRDKYRKEIGRWADG
jgi:hypothetical protein